MEVLAGPEWDVGYEHFLAERGYRVEEEEHARIHQGWYLPLVNDYAMTVQVPDGRFLSAWDYGAARFPLRVAKNDAPPAYLTDIALRFLRETADVPWMMHLSYIYPHCPVAAPAPYHAMYELDQIPPPIRGEEDFAHPVLQEMRNEHRSRPFGKDEVWRLIRAAYYGMVTCVDEQLGRVIAALNETGQLDRTVIVLTSDHGDYLGDHYLSEKEFFFDQAIRVPLIVSHPDTACRRMDGAVRDEFVQSVDVLPTLLDCAEIPHDDRIQGRSFLPLLSDPAKRSWQEAVFGDWDFEFNAFAARLGLRPERCRAWMVRDRHYKYIHFLDLPDMLFDLCNDPDELHNIADTTAGRAAVDRYRLKLLDWRMETEDRSRSGWYLRRWGARGVPLPADSFADYEFDAPHDHKDSDGAGGEEE
jgi:arylsulfatase A-like enzyme